MMQVGGSIVFYQHIIGATVEIPMTPLSNVNANLYITTLWASGNNIKLYIDDDLYYTLFQSVGTYHKFYNVQYYISLSGIDTSKFSSRYLFRNGLSMIFASQEYMGTYIDGCAQGAGSNQMNKAIVTANSEIDIIQIGNQVYKPAMRGNVVGMANVDSGEFYPSSNGGQVYD